MLYITAVRTSSDCPRNCTGQISIHYPKHKLLHSNFKLIPKPLKSNQHLRALTLFTDGSGKSHKSVIAWQDPETNDWQSNIEIVKGSPQIVELAEVVRAFSKFTCPFNLVMDSAYVLGIVEKAENSFLKEITNDQLHSLPKNLIFLLIQRQHPYFIMHIRSCTSLPGPLPQGNAQEDTLAMAAQTILASIFEQAKLSLTFFHQNAHALHRMFNITKDQVKAIVSICPSCQIFSLTSTGEGVNPRGLHSLQIGQTDITHYLSFGRFKYIHVSVDAFSGAICALAHM